LKIVYLLFRPIIIIIIIVCSSGFLLFPEERDAKAAKGRQESQDQQIDAYLWSLFSLLPAEFVMWSRRTAQKLS